MLTTDELRAEAEVAGFEVVRTVSAPSRMTVSQGLLLLARRPES